MSQQGDTEEVQGEQKIRPLYFKAKDIPGKTTVFEVCREAERVAGTGEVEGAQCIKGLWRLYLNSDQARTTLLIDGMSLKEVTVDLYSTNPFLRPEPEGHYVEVHDMPLSYDNNEISKWLTTHGFEEASPIKYKYARDNNNKLTNFKTGGRFLYVKGPLEQLPRKAQIGLFTVSLWSPARERLPREPKCSNCLQKGHLKQDCIAETVCLACKQQGHKKGECPMNSLEDVSEHTPQDDTPNVWPRPSRSGRAEPRRQEADRGPLPRKGEPQPRVEATPPSQSHRADNATPTDESLILSSRVTEAITRSIAQNLSKYAFAPRSKVDLRPHYKISAKRRREKSGTAKPESQRRKIYNVKDDDTDWENVTAEQHGAAIDHVEKTQTDAEHTGD